VSGRREIAIIGATLDLGQSRRGVDMGPSAMRAAGLEERLVSLGYEVSDHGNVETAVPEATALRDESSNCREGGGGVDRRSAATRSRR